MSNMLAYQLEQIRWENKQYPYHVLVSCTGHSNFRNIAKLLPRPGAVRKQYANPNTRTRTYLFMFKNPLQQEQAFDAMRDMPGLRWVGIPAGSR